MHATRISGRRGSAAPSESSSTKGPRAVGMEIQSCLLILRPGCVCPPGAGNPARIGASPITSDMLIARFSTATCKRTWSLSWRCRTTERDFSAHALAKREIRHPGHAGIATAKSQPLHDCSTHELGVELSEHRMTTMGRARPVGGVQNCHSHEVRNKQPVLVPAEREVPARSSRSTEAPPFRR